MQTSLELARSITEEEIGYICTATGDSVDFEKHKAALRSLIFDQDCVITSEQCWYPYECVELMRWSCQQGHEREFAICNVIIAISIIADADHFNDPKDMLETIAPEYAKLPVILRKMVLNTIQTAIQAYDAGG